MPRSEFPTVAGPRSEILTTAGKLGASLSQNSTTGRGNNNNF